MAVIEGIATGIIANFIFEKGKKLFKSSKDKELIENSLSYFFNNLNDIDLSTLTRLCNKNSEECKNKILNFMLNGDESEIGSYVKECCESDDLDNLQTLINLFKSIRENINNNFNKYANEVFLPAKEKNLKNRIENIDDEIKKAKLLALLEHYKEIKEEQEFDFGKEGIDIKIVAKIAELEKKLSMLEK